MRRFVIALLLASAAGPAMADDAKIKVRGERGVEASSEPQAEPAPEARPERAERRREPLGERFGGTDSDGPKLRAERQRSFQGEPAEVTVERAERRAGDTVRQWRERPAEAVDIEPPRRIEPKTVRPPRHVSMEQAEPGGEGAATIEERNLRRAPVTAGGGDLVQQKRPLPRVLDPRDRRVSRSPLPGTEPPAPRSAATMAARPERQWSTHWRHDRRYDWRDWRRRHRDRFRFGFYYDPFGWDYFRYGIGWRLWPVYYRSSYWLRDPWEYRLPPAYGPYRWVRYHHDALLVNIYTGQVVDVVYDFFW